MPSICGVHHVSFSVTDLERSVAWYQEALGFAHHSDVEAATFRRVRLRHPEGGPVVTLTRHDDSTGERFTEVHAGLDHLAFQVGDGEIGAWKRWFEDRGVEHAKIRPNGVGGGTIALRDPDGIQLEVFALPAE